MSRTIVENLLPSAEKDNRKWLIVGALSLSLHILVVLWFSSRTPDFPDLESNDFKVGLNSSDGLGETLQASLPDLISAEEVATEEISNIVEQTTVKDVVQAQAIEVTEPVSVDQTEVENVDLAQVVMPDTHSGAELAPPALSELAEMKEIKVEESQPVESIESAAPSVSSVDVDIIETAGVLPDVEDVASVDEFFQPAKVISADDPITSLPIEQLAAVPAPMAIFPDTNPELANQDVEILEIKAREVRIQSKPISRVAKRSEQTTGVGNNSRTPTQSLSGNAGNQLEQTQAAAPIEKEPTPVVIPKTYVVELKSWLNLYKQYPLQAHRSKQEGVVIIALQIERSGKIINYEIKRSSGHQLLDQEVEKMMQRAAKMPALPADFPRDSLELLIPISFRVKA